MPNIKWRNKVHWQNTFLSIVLVSLLVMSFLSGCASQTTPIAGGAASPTLAPAVASPVSEEPSATATSQAEIVTDYPSLVEALRARNPQFQPAGVLEQPFFPVEAQLLDLGGQQVQIFEFPDAQAAEAAAATVSSSGDSVGTTMMTWIEPPHFYHKDRLIVLYVGSDPTMLKLLEETLGEPFAERG